MGWRRPFGFKCQLEMTDDPVDNLMVLNERDDSHSASTGRTDQRVHLKNLADYLGPAFGRYISRVFYDWVMRRGRPCLTALPPWALE